MAETSLTWRQVNAWRLSQHCLSQRLPRQDFVDAALRTGGVQAQVMSAAELALWARVDGLSPQEVQAALWQERTLVKTWAMRGTLHLIAAGEAPLYAAARSLYETRNWTRYFNFFGVTPTQYEAFLAAVPQVLGSTPLTREQLAAAVAEETGVPELHSLVISKGWGTPLKPSAWRGDLCFGPNQGRNVTFVNPRRWIGSWRAVEPYTALQEVARRYLQTYGPARPQDFALWWELRVVPARKLFQSIADELVAVEVEGWRALALRSTLAPMQSLETPASVRLLPLFDAYVLGLGRGLELEPLLAREYQRLVYRPQGWISAVVLVNGYITGVWEYQTRRSQTVVQVRLFSVPTVAIRQGIEAEAARLGAFLNTPVVVANIDTI
jgi:hypothetical protein